MINRTKRQSTIIVKENVELMSIDIEVELLILSTSFQDFSMVLVCTIWCGLSRETFTANYYDRPTDLIDTLNNIHICVKNDIFYNNAKASQKTWRRRCSFINVHLAMHSISVLFSGLSQDIHAWWRTKYYWSRPLTVPRVSFIRILNQA